MYNLIVSRIMREYLPNLGNPHSTKTLCRIFTWKGSINDILGDTILIQQYLWHIHGLKAQRLRFLRPRPHRQLLCGHRNFSRPHQQRVKVGVLTEVMDRKPGSWLTQTGNYQQNLGETWWNLMVAASWLKHYLHDTTSSSRATAVSVQYIPLWNLTYKLAKDFLTFSLGLLNYVLNLWFFHCWSKGSVEEGEPPSVTGAQCPHQLLSKVPWWRWRRLFGHLKLAVFVQALRSLFRSQSKLTNINDWYTQNPNPKSKHDCSWHMSSPWPSATWICCTCHPSGALFLTLAPFAIYIPKYLHTVILLNCRQFPNQIQFLEPSDWRPCRWRVCLQNIQVLPCCLAICKMHSNGADMCSWNFS